MSFTLPLSVTSVQTRAFELYENPPIATDHVERVTNGIKYHKTRGWSVNKAALCYCDVILRMELARNLGENLSFLTRKLIWRWGTIEQRSLSLDAVLNTPQHFSAILNEVKRSSTENSNSASLFADEISPRTLRKYKQLCEVKACKGDVKNKSRQAAFENIRNPLSLCSVLQNVHPELFMSTDDISVLLNGWDLNPEVLTTGY